MKGTAVKRRVAAGAVLLALLLGAGPAAAGPGAAELQAAFIAKIVRFVEWPAGTFESDTAPIRVGVLGDGELVGALRTVLAGQDVQGRSFVLRRLEGVHQPSQTHVVVLTERGRSVERQTARALEALPVLSIGPSFRFAEYGGSIGMELYRGKIAFDVNHSAVRDQGLRISSRVLKLATTVH